MHPNLRRAAALVATVLALAPASVRAAGPVSVSDAWSQPASGTARVYATVTNAGDEPDRLIGASSPSAAAVELHDAAKGTAPVAAVAIPARATVTLAPAGAYLMLTGLKADVQPNDAFFARLHFERAGWVVAIVHVRGGGAAVGTPSGPAPATSPLPIPANPVIPVPTIQH